MANIESHINEPIGRYFDLIVGTSTGGIIALGLGAGFSADEMLQFYLEHGPVIFGNGQKRGLWQSLTSAKFDSHELKNALIKRFGNKKLGDCKTRIVVPSFNVDLEEVHIFKTSHNERFMVDYNVSIADVALATSAAPTFLPVHQVASSGASHIDGGMYANNPTGLAVVEAVGVLGWAPNELLVLSLGCTATPLSVDIINRQDIGLVGWLLNIKDRHLKSNILDTVMTAQCSFSTGTANLLMRPPSQLIRIDFKADNGRYGLDDLRGIDSLKGLGSSKARKYFPDIKDLFFDVVAEEFIPCHTLEDAL